MNVKCCWCKKTVNTEMDHVSKFGVYSCTKTTEPMVVQEPVKNVKKCLKETDHDWEERPSSPNSCAYGSHGYKTCRICKKCEQMCNHRGDNRAPWDFFSANSQDISRFNISPFRN